MSDGDKVDNPWLGCDGSLRDGELTLKHDAALDAAKKAAIAANTLESLKGYQHLLTNHKGFNDNGPLTKCQQLAAEFDAQGKQLDTVLNHYIDLVNAMADVMIRADKDYKAAEEDSKHKFDQLKTDNPVGGGNPTLAHGKIPSFDTDKMQPLDAKHGYGDLSDIAHSKNHSQAIVPEDPYSLTHEQFHEARVAMNPQLVADAGATWLLVAGKLDTAFGDLNTQLQKMETDKSWTGLGAKGAITASGRFKTQAADLSSDLRAISSNLIAVSGWLANTQVYLPPNAPTDADYDRPQREDRILTRARLGFTNWYIPGLSAAGPAIPILADPTAPMPGGGSPRNYYTGDGGGGGGGRAQPRGKIGATGAPTFGDGSTPSGTSSKGGSGAGAGAKGSNPNGTDPKGNGSNPNGSNPNGSNPNGSSPGGSGGSNSGSNPSSSQSGDSSSQLSQLSSALQQGMQSLQSQTQQSNKQSDLSKQLENSPLAALPNLLDQLKTAGGGGPGGGGPGGKSPLEPAQAKLFPRAAVTAEVAEAEVLGASRAGVAAGASPMGGMGGGMGGMGHGGGAHGAGGKEHKRPDFLDRAEYLDEAMGTPPVVAKPVVEG
ncbi:WXG100 family type VII secretion target [Nocardia sp. NPDC059240]|uniref:WXG100 family type VII secretion target n=1 Tax=Nocardia sp. NPDC059240 TaxID=3346786 RepID=UPI0036AF0AB9